MIARWLKSISYYVKSKTSIEMNFINLILAAKLIIRPGLTVSKRYESSSGYKMMKVKVTDKNHVVIFIVTRKLISF